jgi:hypothetical protein
VLGSDKGTPGFGIGGLDDVYLIISAKALRFPAKRRILAVHHAFTTIIYDTRDTDHGTCTSWPFLLIILPVALHPILQSSTTQGPQSG